jgi:hypothetical protein
MVMAAPRTAARQAGAIGGQCPGISGGTAPRVLVLRPGRLPSALARPGGSCRCRVVPRRVPHQRAALRAAPDDPVPAAA